MNVFYRFRIRMLAVLGVLLAVVAMPARAQQGAVTGRVTDQSTQQALVGARVTLVGTVLATETNAEGRFTLRAPLGPATLRVNALGYAAATREVTIAAGQPVSVDVALELVSRYRLDEIVVTATGQQERREIANSISRVEAGELVPIAPIQNMNDLISARVPGVEVLASPMLGGGARVRIRGNNSLSLSNEPVYYIDGVRMQSSVNSSSIGIGGTNPSRLNDINPEEIESFEVVKGPSASTLYGTDAANGVVVIRTRRGRAGAPRFNIYTELGIMRDNNQYPTAYRGWMTNPTDTSFAANSRPTNGVQCFLTQVAAGTCAQDSVSRFNLFEDPVASPNGTGYRGQVGLQVSGGTDAVRYFLSGEYEDEIGLLRMPEFAYGRVLAARQISEVPYEQYRPNARRRTSIRANIETNLTPRLDLAVSTGFISSTQRLPQTDNNTTGLLSNGFGGPGNRDNGNFGYRLFTPDGFFSETVNQDINRFIGSATARWRPTA